MMTIQGNLAGSYPQNNVTPIHPRKMMPTGDTTNAQPTLPDAGRMTGNEGDSFTPSSTGSADLNNTPAVSDAGDTVTVKHNKKPKKTEKQSNPKKPEKKKGFWGLPWYGKTAVVLGGTIIATPLLALGAAHIWANFGSKKAFIKTDEITQLNAQLTEALGSKNFDEAFRITNDIHKKIKLGNLEKFHEDDVLKQVSYFIKTGAGVINNLPKENRKLLVGYVSWGMWGDLLDKSKGRKEVIKNITATLGVPAKKGLQMLGDRYKTKSETDIRAELGNRKLIKIKFLNNFVNNLATDIVLAAVEMKSKSPRIPYSQIKGHVVETLEKINSSITNSSEQYILTPFKNGNPQDFGSASVGQCYSIQKKNGETEIVKYFTAHPDSVEEYFNVFYDIFRRGIPVAYESTVSQFKETQPNAKLEDCTDPLVRLINSVILPMVKKNDSALSEEQATIKSIELLASYLAVDNSDTLIGELQTTREKISSIKMKEALQKSGLGTFAQITNDGADFGSQRLVTVELAEGVNLNSNAFKALSKAEQLKAKCHWARLQTIYGHFHNDLHSDNLNFEITDGKFIRINEFDPGRISILGQPQAKAMNGLQLLSLIEDPSVVDSNKYTSSRFETEAKAFRQSLFRADSPYSNSEGKFKTYSNPLLMAFDYSEQITAGTTAEGQYGWKPSDISQRGKKYTEAIGEEGREYDSIEWKEHQALAYNDDEKTVLKAEAKSLVDHLVKSSELTLKPDERAKAEKNALSYMIEIVDPDAWKTSNRYKSLGLS